MRMTAISSQKIWFTAISSTKKVDPIYWEVEKNCLTAVMSMNHSFEAIWRE